MQTWMHNKSVKMMTTTATYVESRVFGYSNIFSEHHQSASWAQHLFCLWDISKKKKKHILILNNSICLLLKLPIQYSQKRLYTSTAANIQKESKQKDRCAPILSLGCKLIKFKDDSTFAMCFVQDPWCIDHKAQQIKATVPSLRMPNWWNFLHIFFQ